MSSRTPLILGLLGLAAISGGIVWFTRVPSPTTATLPTLAPKTSAPASTVVLDHQLATPEKSQGAAPVAGQAQPAPSDRRQATDPKNQNPHLVAPGFVAVPGAFEIAVAEPPAAGSEPPKLGSIVPILGGAAAIKGRYFKSTYAERRERADLLETVLNSGEPREPDQVETITALKDELVWLNENMGTPPEPPK